MTLLLPLKKGWKDLAKTRFEDVISIDPKHALAYANIGQIHYDEGRGHDAVVNYEKAIACDPHPQYFNNIGTSLIERNRWEDAEACYREAIRLDPKLAIAYNNLGVVFCWCADVQKKQRLSFVRPSKSRRIMQSRMLL